MKVLLLYVHPRPESFCAQARDAARDALTALGHQVEIADLYAERFDPAMTAEDFNQFAGLPMPSEILREQARVDRNEALIVITPIWWWQYPAMLKGWIDRVFTDGWAFQDSREPNAAPIFGLKHVLILASAGAGPARFAKYGYLEGIRTTWDTGVWGYCGIPVDTRLLWEVRPFSMTPAELAARMAEVRAHVTDFIGSVERAGDPPTRPSLSAVTAPVPPLASPGAALSA
jgi:NAD(P)H dehydrogenase (quinone)